MNRRWRFRLSLACAALTALVASAAIAHSASDAYLTLEAPVRAVPGTGRSTVLHGQWDIALRDLHFVLGLDDDGDGNITWGEVRRHQAAIARYAYASLRVSGDGKACTVTPTRQAVADHADGAYSALFFDITCADAPKRLALDYRLFFAVDPSHRGIFVLHSGAGTATALLSPDNARIELPIQKTVAATNARIGRASNERSVP